MTDHLFPISLPLPIDSSLRIVSMGFLLVSTAPSLLSV